MMEQIDFEFIGYIYGRITQIKILDDDNQTPYYKQA